MPSMPQIHWQTLIVAVVFILIVVAIFHKVAHH